jgi:2,4-dienoyl-CoA reductase-like NADH-dependent reductase (Old Yellow Enzyme family)
MSTTDLADLDRVVDPKIELLFRPTSIGSRRLANRVVMAPMTRTLSPRGIPGPKNAAYYRRRVKGGAGLIITEGTWVPDPAAANEEDAPRIYGEDALAGWKHVVRQVHEETVPIFCQLWHVGQIRQAVLEGLYEVKPKDHQHPRQVGPSVIVGGIGSELIKEAEPARRNRFCRRCVRRGGGQCQSSRFRRGRDPRGARLSLRPVFLTNHRTDHYGGSWGNRTRPAIDTVREIRRKVGSDFPISFRLSQWKQQDYQANLFATPNDFECLLLPLVEAGVDVFHCSQRRFWEPEFGTNLNLAGWAKKITGKPTISVGSVGMTSDHIEALVMGNVGDVQGLANLLGAMDRNDFDLIAIGQGMLADPEWAHKVRRGELEKRNRYTKDLLKDLV